MGLEVPIDITAEQRKTVLALLASHLPNTTAWVYGSRVKWTARPESDLDLVVFARREQSGRVSGLKEAFEESNLPFRVDLFVWDEVPEQFRKQIEAEHVVLVEKQELGGAGDGWVSLRLGDVCTKIGSGATPRGGREVYLKDGPCALIRSQNVYNNRFSHDGLAFINHQQATELNNVEVIADDVLLNITGDSVARVCQVRSDVLPARVNQHVAIIRPDPKKLSARFLRYFLVSPETQVMLLSWAGSGGTRNALTKGMIESFHVPAPVNVAEQRAIAHILGTLDDKIELNRRINQTLEEMARALFKSWFVDFDPVRAKATLKQRDATPSQGGSDWSVERARAYLDRMGPNIAALFPDSFVDSELGLIPKGWEIGTVSQLAEKIQNGGTPKRSEPTYWERAEIPWLTSGEVRQSFIVEAQNFISEEGLANSSAKMVPARSILVALYGATAGQVCMNYRTLSTNQAISAVIPSRGDRYFCLARLKSKVSDLENRAVGSAQQNISKKIVEETIVLLPQIELRSAYDVFVEPLFDQIFQNMDENQTLTGLRDALLPQLISGGVRIGDKSNSDED